MKTKIAVWAASCAVWVSPVFAADAAVSAPAETRVEVVFVSPEKFTDVKDTEMATEGGREAILVQLKEHVVERATAALPEGTRLSITVTDVDLAGDFEPWRAPQHSDIRVVKDIYPPRIALRFKLTDAAGAVVKEGERELRDLSFQMNATPAFSSDSLRYEKTLLDDWVRKEFAKPKAAKPAKPAKGTSAAGD